MPSAYGMAGVHYVFLPIASVEGNSPGRVNDSEPSRAHRQCHEIPSCITECNLASKGWQELLSDSILEWLEQVFDVRDGPSQVGPFAG